jgi:uncharacterized membrane protein YbhN (UPF0104 family)
LVWSGFSSQSEGKGEGTQKREKIEEETQGEEKIDKWKRGKGKGKACKHWGTSFVVWACSLFRACSLFKAFYPSSPPFFLRPISLVRYISLEP